MKFYLAKQGNKFIPSTQEDQIKAYKIPQGHVVECKSMKQRNYMFLKKYWKLATFVALNIPETENKDLLERHQYEIKTKYDFHFYVKLKKGYIDRKFIAKDGSIGWETKSISFKDMEPHEFDQFYSDALDVAFELLSSDEESTNNLISFMG